MYQPPSLRLALGLGDQELEQRLRPAFDAADDLLVVAQCLAAEQVIQAVDSGGVDAVVVAWTLHRLTDAVLDQLERPRIRLVVLVAEPAAERWRTRRGTVLPLDADPATIRQALLAARGSEHIARRPRPSAQPVPLKPVDMPEPGPAPSTIAVIGGAGSPGRTTVALNLVIALGAAAPTVLVELDLDAPSVAAYLDRDPSRNICTLAHAVREDPHAWSAALIDELQPLSPHSPSGMVLCGPPKREMRTSLAPAFVERLIRELARRYRYVVLDIGAELLGVETAAANHRAAIVCAQQLLLVSRSDLVGLWHTRTALGQLESQLGIERAALQLVLNRHDPRHHHSRAEVEWHLGAPVVAVVTADAAATERAIAAQRPLVVDRASRAGRSLLALAEQLHDGKLRLPANGSAEAPAGGRPWWRQPFRQPAAVAPKHHLPTEPQPIRATGRSTSGGRVVW
ncbi:MAG TPA: hypothetical protein VGQ62_00340 [Chloroflexota bacterium]|nr:hypothetical protein [Chloroflexota bacterium]